MVAEKEYKVRELHLEYACRSNVGKIFSTMLFRISENASFVAPHHRIQKKELWLTRSFPRNHSKVKLRYRTEMDFWTSHLLKRSYSLEASRASLKSLQYDVQFTRSLWVSLIGPEGLQWKSTTRCFSKT